MIRISFHLLICLTWTWFRDTEFSLMTEDKGILSDIENRAKVVFFSVFSPQCAFGLCVRVFHFTFSTFFFFFARICWHSLQVETSGSFTFFCFLFPFLPRIYVNPWCVVAKNSKKILCLVREREKISYGQLPRFFS